MTPESRYRTRRGHPPRERLSAHLVTGFRSILCPLKIDVPPRIVGGLRLSDLRALHRDLVRGRRADRRRRLGLRHDPHNGRQGTQAEDGQDRHGTSSLHTSATRGRPRPRRRRCGPGCPGRGRSGGSCGDLCARRSPARRAGCAGVEGEGGRRVPQGVRRQLLPGLDARSAGEPAHQLPQVPLPQPPPVAVPSSGPASCAGLPSPARCARSMR